MQTATSKVKPRKTASQAYEDGKNAKALGKHPVFDNPYDIRNTWVSDLWTAWLEGCGGEPMSVDNGQW